MTKARSLFALIAVLAGLLVSADRVEAVTLPAIQQFHPQAEPFATGGNCAISPGCVGDVLSDKQDRDQRAHLTVVTTPPATRVQWYVCPLGFPAVPTNADLQRCTFNIGGDSTPRKPGTGLEAYDRTWNIPASLDQRRRDIVAIACNGKALRLTGSRRNCVAGQEDNIFLDDASAGPALNQTASGEFTALRTGSCIGSSTPRCEDAYRAFPHGIAVPNALFELRAVTSDEVDNLQVAFNSPVSATVQPSNSNFAGFVNCTLERTFTTTKRFRCTVNPPDNVGIALELLVANAVGADPAGEAGYCNSNNNPASAAEHRIVGAHDACVIDTHLVVSR